MAHAYNGYTSDVKRGVQLYIYTELNRDGLKRQQTRDRIIEMLHSQILLPLDS